MSIDDDALELSELVEKFRDENKLNGTEGETGVRNLCKLVKALGYKDPQYFGQFLGGSYGDLINFLEDNSGAVNAIIDWIGETDLPEWREALEEEVGTETQ